MDEQWISIPNTGSYMVSKDGRIKSPDTKLTWGVRKGKILKHRLLHGYPTVAMKVNGVRKHLSIHRLVAAAFIPNPNNYKCVNHKDGNKQNNNVENLEWCTYSHNLLHAYTTGLQPRGSKKFSAKLDESQVRVIKSLLADSPLSRIQIASYFKVSDKTIGSISQGKKWAHITIEKEYKMAA